MQNFQEPGKRCRRRYQERWGRLRYRPGRRRMDVVYVWPAIHMHEGAPHLMMPASAAWTMANVAAAVTMWVVMTAAVMLPGGRAHGAPLRPAGRARRPERGLTPYRHLRARLSADVGRLQPRGDRGSVGTTGRPCPVPHGRGHQPLGHIAAARRIPAAGQERPDRRRTDRGLRGRGGDHP